MKNDVQDHGKKKDQSSSEFPMANRIAKTEDFLKSHTGEASEQTQSLSEVLKQRLGPQNQEALEKMFARVNEVVQSGVEYINENPNDSKIVAATGELAAWVKKQAEPGIKAVGTATENVLPQVEDWIKDLLSKGSGKEKEKPQ